MNKKMNFIDFKNYIKQDILKKKEGTLAKISSAIYNFNQQKDFKAVGYCYAYASCFCIQTNLVKWIDIYCKKGIDVFEENKIEATSNIYNIIGLEFFKLKQLKASIPYFEKAVLEAKKFNNKVAECGNLNNLGNCFKVNDNPFKAKVTFAKALKIANQEQDAKNIANITNNIGTIYFKTGEHEKALSFFSKSIKAWGSFSKKIPAHLLINMGNVYYELKQPKAAISNFSQALLIKKQQNDLEGIARIYNNLANVYWLQDKEKLAKEFYLKAEKINKKKGFMHELAINYNNLAKLEIKEKKFEKANKLIIKSKKIKQKLGLKHSLLITEIVYAKSLIGLKKFEEAKNNIEKVLKVATNSKVLNLVSSCYYTLAILYKEKKDFENSNYYYEKYIESKQQENVEDLKNKIAIAKADFEVELKEKEVEIYKLQNEELQDKNKQILLQKNKLEKAIADLHDSEIKYNIVAQELKQKIGYNIIGVSPEIKQVIYNIKKVAKSKNTTVLIVGETGTGKELVARAIHDNSSKCNSNFCAVNVSAITESLFESEFFGHTKNAFTGADKNKNGWFEIANNGTLFLDEISTLPLHLQAKFLRTFEEKKITKIGSTTEKKIDFRLICATNDDLEDLIKSNKFRMDLYHRISTFVINVPPLRKRIEDIPILLNYFVAHFSKNLNKKITRIEKQLVLALQSYDFPGNVRELKNMVERAIILNNSSTLKLSSFNLHFTSNEEKIIPLSENEKKMVLKALKQTKFNQKKAAELLQITAKSLERRMIKYGIKKK